MRGRTAWDRKRRVVNPERGVTIGNENWAKLVKLAKPKEGDLLVKAESEYKIIDILRAAVERFNRRNWLTDSGALNAAQRHESFTYKPVMVAGFGRTMSTGAPSLKEIKPNCPVLIDHSILLLAVLQLSGAAFDTRWPFADNLQGKFVPCSKACVALLNSVHKRGVMIHHLHEAEFLLELRRLVRPHFAADLAGLARYMMEKACQLSGLDLEVLRLDYSETDLIGTDFDFTYTLAISAAKAYLGTDTFALASAFLPTTELDGIKVFAPADLPKKAIFDAPSVPEPDLGLETAVGAAT